MREHQQHALSEQQPECHHQLRDATGAGLELAILDFHLQHPDLRKSGQCKLYVPVSRYSQPQPAYANGAGVLSRLAPARWLMEQLSN